MNYLWTEDKGAGFHYWQLVNQHLFHGRLVVESKISNQGILDAVRQLKPRIEDRYYIAFDMVYDNMDVVNKLLELQHLIQQFPRQIILLDITCFESIILLFSHLKEWTGSGRKDKLEMRKHILNALCNHRIEIEKIEDQKTLNYIMGFKKFSTERVLKSIAYELTDGDAWTIKGERMGECWYKDCCVLDNPEKSHCGVMAMPGVEKLETLLADSETQRITKGIRISLDS